MYRLYISYQEFYITLNDMWLYESDPNAPVHVGKLLANCGNSNVPYTLQWQE